MKIINDRLNHLKSLLADATRAKLTKTIDGDWIEELKIRINELEQLKKKL